MAAERSLEAPTAGAAFDALLVTLVLGGDRRAGGRLAARWQPRLLRTARRLTGDPDMAVQAAQESWLAIWRGLESLRDPARFGPWAFGILRHKCADAVSHRAADRARSGGGDSANQRSHPALDDALAIRLAFAALSDDHRLAAHLHFVEGLTLAEIAEVQDVPLGTAKSRLFHARRQLKTALSGDVP